MPLPDAATSRRETDRSIWVASTPAPGHHLAARIDGSTPRLPAWKALPVAITPNSMLAAIA